MSNKFQSISDLSKSIFEGNTARGFWDNGPDRNKGEAIMLIITELSEAVDAHRKGRTVKFKVNQLDSKAGAQETLKFLLLYSDRLSHSDPLSMSFNAEGWKRNFEDCVKDTIEDELADAAIRLLDTAYGFNYSPLKEVDISLAKPLVDNFSENCLIISHLLGIIYNDISSSYINPAHHTADFSAVLVYIIQLSEKEDIDLLLHIKLKLAYNALRPYKHGGKY